MMNKLLSAIVLVLVIVTLGQGRVINQLNKDVAEAKERADQSSSEAFGDCQRIMAQNEFMVRINTCIEVINTMCKEKADCMAYFQPMCTSEDHE